MSCNINNIDIENEILVHDVEEHWNQLTFKQQLDFIVFHFSSESIVKTIVNEVDLYHSIIAKLIQLKIDERL